MPWTSTRTSDARCVRRFPPRNLARGGFTLIEILIVVAILGILAAIVVPELSSASRQTRENVLKDDMRFMREQMLRYRIQHNDVPPGYVGGVTSGVPTEAAVVAQLTQFSDMLGNTSPAGSNVFEYGPYLQRIPENPLTGKSGILVVANGGAMPAANPIANHGWIYKPETMEFKPNNVGQDMEGKNFADY
jgi:general secretion pathway protein G